MKGCAMADDKEVISKEKAAKEIAGKAIDKNIQSGGGSEPGNNCTGSKFGCGDYSCKAPDDCVNNFNCGTYKEPYQE